MVKRAFEKLSEQLRGKAVDCVKVLSGLSLVNLSGTADIHPSLYKGDRCFFIYMTNKIKFGGLEYEKND